MYQNVADTAISAEDAAASITSQIRAFGEDASFATEVIDAYNEVANNFSVGTNDLASAMEIASSGMATYGNEFSEIIGLVTAGTEIMTGRSSQVARGLNTIAARIVKNKSALATYGIQVEGANGKLKSTYDVLTELKPKWDSMSDAQKTALGDTIAGTNQYKVLAAVMQNMDTAISANETALSSQGSAMNENSKYMESFEAHVTNLSAKWQDFSNNVVNNGFVKVLMEVGGILMDIANTDIGHIVAQVMLLSSVGWGASALLKTTKLVSNIKKQFSDFGAVLSLVAEKAGTFGEAISAAGGFASVALPIFIAITAAAAVLGKVIPAVVKAIKEAQYNSSLEGKVEAFHKETESANELQSKYEEAKTRLEQLNATPFKNRTSAMQEEIDRLNVLLAAYKALLDDANEEKLEAAREVSEAALENGFAGMHRATLKSTVPAYGYIPYEEIKKLSTATYKNLDDAVLSTYTKLVNLSTEFKVAGKNSANLHEGLTNLLKDFLSGKAEIYDLRLELANYGVVIQSSSVSVEELGQKFAELGKGTNGAVGGQTKAFDVKEFLSWKQVYAEVYDAETLLINNNQKLDNTSQNTRNEFEKMATVYYMLQHKTEDYSQQVKGLATQYGITEEHAAHLIMTNTALANSFQSLSQAAGTGLLEPAMIGIVKYIDLIDNAINVKSKFDDLISSGGMNYSSGYEGYADVYAQMQEYLSRGQIGGEFQAGASLLFDESTYQEFISAMKTDLPRAMEIAQQAMGKLAPLFGDANNAGLGFLATIKKMSDNGTLLGATYQDVDGQTTITVDNLDALAGSLGVSTSGVFSAIQAWKDYGINAKITSSELIGYLSDIGVSINDNTIDMNSVVEKMRELGATDSDIMNLQTLLSDMDGITLKNPIASIDDLKTESDKTEDAADGVTDSLNEINGVTFSSVRTNLSLLNADLYNTEKQANNTRSAIADINTAGGGNNDRHGNGSKEPEGGKSAKGTRSARGGLTLVNEEGPEIIQENGKQRIANNGLPTLTNIKKGAVVYNAKDTAKMTMQKAGISGSATVSSSYLDALFNRYGLSSSGSSYASSGSSSGYLSSHTSSGYSGSSSSDTEDAWKKEFEEWLKWKDHQLAMDQITEQAYYDELNKMNEKYFANRAEYLEDYWKYQEQIYKWQKDKEKDLLNRQLDDLKELEDAINEKYDAQISALEDENKELDDQLKYEELLENLAKAKAERVLVYKDGRFQYVSGGQSVYDAQAALDAYNRDKALEAQKEEIEKLRENELSAILEQEEKINKQLEDLSDNKGYASGSFGVRGGLSLVGENGPELRVLNRGDGIVPADATANIMRWAGQNPRSFKSGLLNELRNNVGGVVQHFENITLPNVTDIMSFMNEMKRLSRYAYQM